MADPKKLSTDEKLDLILKYQKSAARWSMARTITNWTIILVFVVLPVILTVQWFREFESSGGFQGLQKNVQQLQGSASFMDKIMKQYGINLTK